MSWSHLLAAADDSPAGLHALGVAEEMARAAGARLTVVTVVSAPSGCAPAALARCAPRVAYGLPGIEIVRTAEQVGADLILLGRSPGVAGGPRLGTTADLVARRSRVACLFVPREQDHFERLLVALDGTDRGMAVLSGARDFLGFGEAELEPIFVDSSPESWSREAHTVGSTRILHALGTRGPHAGKTGRLRVLQGEPVSLIREAIDASRGTDVLVVGARRGGPGGAPESTGVGRSLLHTSPCAVLTIPL